MRIARKILFCCIVNHSNILRAYICFQTAPFYALSENLLSPSLQLIMTEALPVSLYFPGFPPDPRPGLLQPDPWDLPHFPRAGLRSVFD